MKVLRAGGSIDPDRWFKRAAHLLHQKSYADVRHYSIRYHILIQQALFCYKKAKGKKGITQCQAWLYEQQGRACRACGDLQGFQENYEKAVDHFLEINLMTEATDCLEALEQYERIASWFPDT